MENFMNKYFLLVVSLLGMATSFNSWGSETLPPEQDPKKIYAALLLQKKILARAQMEYSRTYPTPTSPTPTGYGFHASREHYKDRIQAAQERIACLEETLKPYRKNELDYI